MDNIRIQTITGQDIEKCRELCNELMALQKSLANIHPEAFDSMNFDTRMKKSYESAERSHVAVAFDGDIPIGYVFSTIDLVTEDHRHVLPDWAPKGGQGFYPDWLQLPQYVGCLNNLYLRLEYRHSYLGKKLLDIALNWLESFDDTKISLVFISNGNNGALKFYKKNNFLFSHEVFEGFITAMCRFR